MAISKFEQGTIAPTSETLIRLAKALGVRVEYFFRPDPIRLEAPEYRRRTSLGARKLASVEADVLDQVERFLELIQLFPEPPVQTFELPYVLPSEVDSYEAIEALAIAVRNAWSLGLDAIPDLADTFEERGLLVLTTAHDDSVRFHGLAARVGEVRVIVVGASWPGDRQRSTMACELGHLMLAGRLVEGLDEEKACHRFAAAFLVPEPTARMELGPSRRRLLARELHTLKLRYGFSMAAWVARARDLGIMSPERAAATLRHFSVQGWRKSEPGSAVPAEIPRLMERLAMRALAEEMISEPKAAELLGIRTSDLRKRLSLENINGAARQ
jgi:Zn-dependent peptidase ImmA (M78 family)/transcriptional regulator with XRE-family HTH domain